jgi:hypothetical protein
LNFALGGRSKPSVKAEGFVLPENPGRSGTSFQLPSAALSSWESKVISTIAYALIYFSLAAMALVGAALMIAWWPLRGIRYPQRMVLYGVAGIIILYLVTNYPRY